MGRRIRLEFEGTTYHVYSRGNRKAPVFRGPGDYAAYLRDLEALTREHRTTVVAFCLMPNHPHLCLRTEVGGDPLSVLMQRLNLRHARRFNLAYDVTGHLNEGRYRTQVVDSERYLLTLVRYIHQNPQRAGLVQHLEDWPYSSHHAYLGRAFPWVETRDVLARTDGLAGYERCVGLPVSAEERQGFVQDPRAREASGLADLGLVRRHRLLRSPWHVPVPELPVEVAARAVADSLGLELDGLREPEQKAWSCLGRRQIASALRKQGYRLHEIGRVLGRTEAGISRMLRRVGRQDAFRLRMRLRDLGQEPTASCDTRSLGTSES